MPPKGWKKGVPWVRKPAMRRARRRGRYAKKNGRPNNKALWVVQLPEHADFGWDRVRALAISGGHSISGALSKLFDASGIPFVGFEPPPPGTALRVMESSDYKGGTYFIPRKYIADLERWKSQGLSNTYLVVEIIKRGFATLEREGKVPAYTGPIEDNLIRLTRTRRGD